MKNIEKMTILLSSLVLLSTSFLPSVVHADETNQQTVIANNANIPDINSPIEQPPSDSEQTYYISNAQSFAILEKQGINVKQVLGDAEYEYYLHQDLLRHGGTYIRGNKNGFTIYLNSAVCKVLIWGGSGLIAYYVGPLLSSIGITGGLAASIKTVISGGLSSLGGKATNRGVWIRVGGRHIVSMRYQ